VELIGDAGAKQLVEVKQQGSEKGLAAFFENEKSKGLGVLGANGLPPLPSGQLLSTSNGLKEYTIDKENGYPDK
jgi:hypothetical protein